MSLTDKLRPDELEAFREAFDMFDKNGDGTISTKVRARPVAVACELEANGNYELKCN